MPKNSAVGVVLGGLAFVLGFGMVWHIWWLVIACGLAMWVTLALRASDDESEFVLTAAEVERIGRRPLPRPRSIRPAAGHEPQRHRHAVHHEPQSEAHEQRALGFWLYLMGDAVIFGLLFMTYSIMVGNTAGGPSGRTVVQPEQCRARDGAAAGQQHHLRLRLAVVADRQPRGRAGVAAPDLRAGRGFVFLEVREFLGMIAAGAGPDRSGFLSAFFTLVGTPAPMSASA